MKTLLSASLFLVLFSFASSFPQNIDDSWKLYDDTQVGRVDVTIDPAALVWIYQNVYSDSEFVATLRFRNKYFDETVNSIGFRLRGNTSRVSKKKSFKISFNTFVSGREFHGVDKLNLNGEHNDPSIIRSKLCFDHFHSAGLHASRAAHTEVYINNKYYGLYISVEHVDDEFLTKNFSDDSGNLWKCLYGADLQYLGESQSSYKNLNNNGVPAYELTTNEETGDFSKLVRLIRLINITPASAFPDSIEKVLDVPDVLHYLALNVLFGSWDDYRSLMNNYYLYHEPAKDKFHLIPYDYDNTFGVDWFSVNWTTADPYNFPKVVSGPRPLAEKLLGNSQYRDLYTHFLRFYSTSLMPMNLWEPRLDSLRTMIVTSALADTFRTKDYGFTSGDFFNSYSATGYSNQHVKFGLKQFVNLRTASIAAQLNNANALPVCYKIDYYPKSPRPDDTIYVYASAYSATSLSSVKIKFTEDLSGLTREYPMSFSPVPNTKKVYEADRYYAVIPPLGLNGSGEMKILVKDDANRELAYPRSSVIHIPVTVAANSLVINEFLADNSSSAPDPSGDHDDWLELYNPTSSAVNLAGMYLTDNPSSFTKWRFPLTNVLINPGERVVVWCDEEQTEPGYHSNFKLSKSGEFIALTDSLGVTVLDSLSFGPQSTDVSYGRFPDGSSVWHSLVPTPGSANILTDVIEEEIKAENSFTIYPNPAPDEINILISVDQPMTGSLILYDILGRELKILFEGDFNRGHNSFNFNISSLAGGVYLIKMKSNYFETGVKFIVL